MVVIIVIILSIIYSFLENNEDIESICTVSRNSDRPEKVRVLKRGKAEKVGSSEWNVTEKIEIELS